MRAQPEEQAAQQPITQQTAGAAGRNWARHTVRAVVLLAIGAVVVLLARWFSSLTPIQHFLADYPGTTATPAGTPAGFPAFLPVLHFFNAFLIVLMIKTGWLVRTQQRPPAMWTRNNSGLIKTRNPPRKISLTLWLHLTLDALWVLNGLAFVILTFTSRHWMRLVPTSWAVFPNALSAALQYISLHWPATHGWTNYNSLQMLSYFVTVFIAAPLAAITGVRMSAAWPQQATRPNALYPLQLARAVHFPVMVYFVLFIVVHLTLVLVTGPLRNLNHMYALSNAGGWLGSVVFVVSVLIIGAAWLGTRPSVVTPLANLMGRVSR